MAISHASELDGRLIPHARRLLGLSCTEVLNFTYSTVVENMGREDKMEFDEMLSPTRWRHEDDLRLPERVRQMKAPAWWHGADDPMAKTFSVGG